jgi:DNA invertase Pin-like site-specific DNA recombinase
MGRKPRKNAVKKSLAVAYIRVSTTKERQELGAEAQKAAIERWASEHGVKVVSWHEEEVSGGAPLDARPVLLDAVGAVLAAKAGTLVFSTLDRFSRDPVTAAMVEGELARAGAELVFADGSGNGSDPTAEMVRGIRLAVAKFERRMTGMRIKAALKVKQARGEMTGSAPYGMRAVDGPVRTDKDGNERVIPVLVPDAGEQNVISRILAMSAGGESVRSIQAQLAKDGVTGRAGTPLGVTSIQRILTAKTRP